MTLVDDVKARLEAQITGLTVYKNAVPSGTLPAKYLIVWASAGTETSNRMTDTTNLADPTFWITSVGRLSSPQNSAAAAAFGAREARRAMRDWRPYGAYKVRPEVSQPARRDESLPDATFYAVEQFTVRITV